MSQIKLEENAGNVNLWGPEWNVEGWMQAWLNHLADDDDFWKVCGRLLQ
jgi:hypothetical protein